MKHRLEVSESRTFTRRLAALVSVSGRALKPLLKYGFIGGYKL